MCGAAQRCACRVLYSIYIISIKSTATYQSAHTTAKQYYSKSWDKSLDPCHTTIIHKRPLPFSIVSPLIAV